MKRCLILLLALIFLTACASIAETPKLGATLMLSSTPTNSPVPSITPSPTITPTPIPTLTPTPTPTVIGGYPNRYLSSGGSLELRGAGGEHIQTFFTFPSDIYRSYKKVKWSPTGEYVAVNYLTNGGHLHIFDAQGNEIIYINTGINFYGGSVSATNWDPTGRYLVFSSNGENSYTDLYLFDTETGSITQLTNTYNKDSGAVFSPDGQQIVWNIEGSLFMMDLDGENKRSLGIGLGSFQDWSSDGKFILFGENLDLYLLEVGTNQKTRLTFNGISAVEGNAKISPDGKTITYLEYGFDGPGERFPEQGENLYSINLDDISRRIFLGAVNGYTYSYTPDLTLILTSGWLPSDSILGEPKIYAIRPDGIDITLLSNRGHQLIYGHWQPGSEVYQSFEPLDFLAPTPIPGWSPQENLPIHDSFEEAHLNQERWTIQNSPETDGFRYVILDKALNIRSDTKIKEGGMDAYSTSEIPMKALTVYEARVKTYSGSYGESYAGIRLDTEMNGQPWWVECKLGNDWETPTFYCQVAQSYEDRQIIEYAVRERSVDLNTWYEIRIEISPEYGALQFSLNGEVLGTYLPDNAGDLLTSAKLRPVMGVWCTDGSINASFDDVILGH